MFQRLQQRMNRKKVVPETEPELSSFYPDTEDGASARPSTRRASRPCLRVLTSSFVARSGNHSDHALLARGCVWTAAAQTVATVSQSLVCLFKRYT